MCAAVTNKEHRLQGTYLLRRGQDKILRRIGTVLMETLPDERHLPLRLPGDPASIAPTNAKSASTNGGTARARSPVPVPRAVSRSVDDSPPRVSSHRSTGLDEPDDHVRTFLTLCIADLLLLTTVVYAKDHF